MSVNFQLFVNTMISATDSCYLSYITGVECTDNFWLLLVLGLVKIGGPWTRVHVLYYPVTTTIYMYGKSYPNVISFFLLTFALTLVGNFLNILHAGKGLNLSRNKQIKRINLKKSKKIGYRSGSRHDDTVTL